ncbi:MAG TPA: 50S ribosomal protein L11 methyltransferase [Pyrinomonadaceae bacterium]|nr:50S ribosomal protein L11 methyltransferase [Pyrinomonadaceae bacterium]
MNKHSQWYALDLAIEPTGSEAVQYALMEAGALGTEINDADLSVQIATGYFESLPEREHVRAELAAALRIYDLPSSAVRNMSLREVADEDWLGEWKKSWQPAAVGDRFLVAPPWSEIDDPLGRIVIRIEPGRAFGTGTHETTRLCLATIEKHFAGESFLDVGTGTGILAIAAAKLFPEARIEACDTDAEAVAIAIENARLNGVAESISFRVGSVSESTASAALVCANLTADVIVALLPTLVGATCGRLILSGILEEQLPQVIDALRAQGIVSPDITQDGEWVAVVV